MHDIVSSVDATGCTLVAKLRRHRSAATRRMPRAPSCARGRIVRAHIRIVSIEPENVRGTRSRSMPGPDLIWRAVERKDSTSLDRSDVRSDETPLTRIAKRSDTYDAVPQWRSIHASK